MNRYCTIYLVRHGQSESNKVEVLGDPHSQLSEKGKEQARQRAKEFKHIHFDAVFSSDYLRARQTAEIIALEHKLEVTTTKALQERNWGLLAGEKTEEERLKLKKLLEEYDALDKDKRFKVKLSPDMESDEEAFMRYVTFLREIAIAYPDKTVLMATHARIMKIFLIHIGFGTYEELPSGAVENTGYVKLLSDGIDFFVEETKGINKYKPQLTPDNFGDKK